jgi:hypothetical protein
MLSDHTKLATRDAVPAGLLKYAKHGHQLCVLARSKRSRNTRLENSAWDDHGQLSTWTLSIITRLSKSRFCDTAETANQQPHYGLRDKAESPEPFDYARHAWQCRFEKTSALFCIIMPYNVMYQERLKHKHKKSMRGW